MTDYPQIFRRQAARSVEGQPAGVQQAVLDESRRTSAAVLGFIGAIGALGGYMIPRAFGASSPRARSRSFGRAAAQKHALRAGSSSSRRKGCNDRSLGPRRVERGSR